MSGSTHLAVSNRHREFIRKGLAPARSQSYSCVMRFLSSLIEAILDLGGASYDEDIES